VRQYLEKFAARAVFCFAWVLAGLVPGVACFAQGPADPTVVPVEYHLDSATPMGSAPPELPGVERLGNRPEFLFSVPTSFDFGSYTGLNLDDLGSPHDRPRATLRYTWFSRPSWDIKVGLSATTDPAGNWQRFSTINPDRLHPGGMPTMHFASEGRLSDRWMLSVNAEGLRTTHGQGLDMDVRVDYSLSRDLVLFGSYRLTDSTGDGTETFGFIPSNSAQFGVRLRF
jgi:hypothetical protein